MKETIQVRVEDLIFDTRHSGNENDDLVIFLHGFPETSFMWKNLINEISPLGFYCVAPNMRGYSIGARPDGKINYTLDKLANDVMDIAKSLGRNKFHLVGHDWGAAIGWKVVHDNPEVILSWTGLSVPHLQAFGEAIVNDDEQKKMSSYISSFQWPFLPEMMIRRRDFKLFKRLWKYSNQGEVEDYLSVFRDKKALTAALNYYRSNYKELRNAPKRQILGIITSPTLFIWGKKDMAIGATAVENGHRFMKNDYTFLELDAGHWLVQTKFDEIKSALSQHLMKHMS